MTRKTSTLVLAALLFAALPSASRAQLTPEWIARLPVGSSLSAGTTGFYVDPNGISYVTGNSGSSSSTDVTTAAIDSTGTVLWEQTFNGPNNGSDQSNDVTLAADGTLYVTGNTPSTSGHADVLVLAYDAATGTLLNTIQYASAPFKSESGHFITTDANSDIYVVGGTVGDGPDVMVLKFDAEGQFVWRRTWDGPAASPFSIDTGKDVRIDPNGDLVVAIHGVMSSLHPDYVVIKFAADDGATIWEANWGVSGGDFVRTIEIDAAGDVYATGIGIDFIDKISTIKLSGLDGSLLWQEYDADGFDHGASGLALDGEGGVLITGSTDPDGDNSNFNDQFYTIKRDAVTGAQLWTHKYGDTCVGCFDVPSDVQVDSADRVFVGGITSSAPFSNDIILFVLDNATGVELDRGTSSGTGSEIPRTGLLRFDANFNLYDGGEIYNADTGAVDISVVKWTALGSDGGIPCADTVSFLARCTVRGGTNQLQIRLVLTDAGHNGEQVTVEVDGDPFAVPVNGSRAQTRVNGALPGSHTIELTDPAGCFPPVIRSCP